jgi:DNA-binding NtrC family response regulator
MPVIVVTGLDEVATAVRCMKMGAFDYIVKPVDQDRFITSIKRALDFRELRHENLSLKKSLFDRSLQSPEAFARIITNNDKMHLMFKYVEAIAKTSQPVLITGETGVGKELIAQSLHALSNPKGEIVTVNVAGLDDHIFSDTLFGHKKGAYTGADHARDGLVERAKDGTLFLDEIGDLSQASQVKLLRLIQEKEYYPLGSDVTRRTNARILVSTNCDLEELRKSQSFRADLYYRLFLHHVEIIPLRARRDDIPFLVEAFLEEAASELNKEKPEVPPELFDFLLTYDFPGNVRELKAMVFDAMSRHESGKLPMDRFLEVIQPDVCSEHNIYTKANGANIPLKSMYASIEKIPSLEDSESLLIEEVLKRTGGNQTLAAKILGITRQTLHRRMKEKKEP